MFLSPAHEGIIGYIITKRQLLRTFVASTLLKRLLTELWNQIHTYNLLFAHLGKPCVVVTSLLFGRPTDLFISLSVDSLRTFSIFCHLVLSAAASLRLTRSPTRAAYLSSLGRSRAQRMDSEIQRDGRVLDLTDDAWREDRLPYEDVTIPLVNVVQTDSC